MAYISYDSHLSGRKTASRTPRRFTIAWARLGTVAASLGAWIGLIAAARAIF